MSTQPASARSPWGGVELLERALGYTRGSLALVTPASLRSPTPCVGWDLERLLTHMHDSLTSLHEAGSVRRVRLTASTAPASDLVAALRSRACDLLADWSASWPPGPETALVSSSPDVLVEGRPLSPRVLTSAGALEVAVHGWDVARACGADRPIPDALAVDLLAVAPMLVRASDRPGRFGPSLRASPQASPGEELLAFLGRA